MNHVVYLCREIILNVNKRSLSIDFLLDRTRHLLQVLFMSGSCSYCEEKETVRQDKFIYIVPYHMQRTFKVLYRQKRKIKI